MITNNLLKLTIFVEVVNDRFTIAWTNLFLENPIEVARYTCNILDYSNSNLYNMFKNTRNTTSNLRCYKYYNKYVFDILKRNSYKFLKKYITDSEKTGGVFQYMIEEDGKLFFRVIYDFKNN